MAEVVQWGSMRRVWLLAMQMVGDGRQRVAAMMVVLVLAMYRLLLLLLMLVLENGHGHCEEEFAGAVVEASDAPKVCVYV